MLGASGLISGIRRSTTRAIPSKQSEARLRAAAAKKAENPIPMEAKPVPKRVIELKYPLQALPKSSMATGWVPPLGGTENLPFQFSRTPSAQLPVYADMRNGLTRRTTVIRRYTGDVNELKDELKRLIGDDIKIEHKAASLHINGHHVRKVKLWLRRLGF